MSISFLQPLKLIYSKMIASCALSIIMKLRFSALIGRGSVYP